MAGYIDTTTDEALWTSYNGGRAGAANEHSKVSEMAQWSALLDAKTCDWCGWADERIFDTNIEPYDPPMHHGCRCIIALILASEFPPDPTWGKGPPDAAWPPGRFNGADKAGKPTLRNVPPKPTPQTPLKAKASEWADEYDKTIDPFTDSMFDEKIWQWNQSARRDILPNDVVGGDTMDAFLNTWVGWTDPKKKEFAELVARGNADELLAFYKARPSGLLSDDYFFRLNTIEDAEELIRAWEVQKELAAAVARKRSPDGLEILRGVSIDRSDLGNTLDLFYERVLAGDLEQSIGAGFVDSWTTELEIAKQFAKDVRSGSKSIVFKKRIDPDDVFASWLDHQTMAMQGESEVLWYNWDGTLVPKAARLIDDVLEIEVW